MTLGRETGLGRNVCERLVCFADQHASALDATLPDECAGVTPVDVLNARPKW